MRKPNMPDSPDDAQRIATLRAIDACQQMADLCDELTALAPEATPREFLRSLGALVAGIDLGMKGLVQLARGGANGLAGAGFRAEYDDGTAGQARHFAGTAAAAALVGEKPAAFAAHHVVDPAESIDGQLSTAALEFARLLIGEELPLDQAGNWIVTNICDPEFESTPVITQFDARTNAETAKTSLRARFTDDEWRAVCELPEQVIVAAALAEWTGDFEDLRDVIAGVRGLEMAVDDPSELVRDVVAGRYETGFEWNTNENDPYERIDRTLGLVCEHVAILQKRAIPVAEIEAYARLLLMIANAAVRNSRAGRILKIHDDAVSVRESRFLDRLENTLELCLPGCDTCLA